MVNLFELYNQVHYTLIYFVTVPPGMEPRRKPRATGTIRFLKKSIVLFIPNTNALLKNFSFTIIKVIYMNHIGTLWISAFVSCIFEALIPAHAMSCILLCYSLY